MSRHALGTAAFVSTCAVAVAVAVAVGSGCKPEGAGPLQDRVLKRVLAMKSYRVTLESELFPQLPPKAPAGPDAGPELSYASLTAKLQAEGVMPDKLRVEASSTSGTMTRSLEAVFDGTKVVTAMKIGADPKAFLSADQKKLALPNKPFDVGFSMRGFGFFDGEDYRGTLIRLLSSWAYHDAAKVAFNGKDCWELRGKIDIDAAVNDIVGFDGERAGRIASPPTDLEQAKMRGTMLDEAADAIGKEIKSMTFADVYVNDDGDVIGWRLSGKTGKLMEVKVVAFERDAGIDGARFTVPPSTTEIARDVTEAAAKTREGPLPPAGELRSFKDQIRMAALKPDGPSMPPGALSSPGGGHGGASSQPSGASSQPSGAPSSQPSAPPAPPGTQNL